MPQKTIFSKALALLWPYILTVVSCAYLLGYHFGYSKFDSEKNQLVSDTTSLNAKNKALKCRLDFIMDSLNIVHPAADTNTISVMNSGNLAAGFDMGVATANNDTGWVKKIADAQVIKYRGGGPWGTIFITVGKPVPIGQRHFKDFSKYKTISVELKGTVGDLVLIGLKSNTDPDDGAETKYPIPIIHEGWNTYPVKLNEFTSADLTHLFVALELVFDEKQKTLFLRNIKFVK